MPDVTNLDRFMRIYQEVRRYTSSYLFKYVKQIIKINVAKCGNVNYRTLKVSSNFSLEMALTRKYEVLCRSETYNTRLPVRSNCSVLSVIYGKSTHYHLHINNFRSVLLSYGNCLPVALRCIKPSTFTDRTRLFLAEKPP